MDINFNRIEPSRQVGNVDKTKRVRKPNKDEAEQNGKRFREQLSQAAGEDKEENKQDREAKSGTPRKSEEKREKKQLPQPDDDEEKIIGGNLDITV